MISNAAIGCVALALAIVTGPVAHAQQGLGFPIIGIGNGQTAKLNVLNLAAFNRADPSTCSVELQFLDISGKQYKQNGFQVTAGQAVAIELKRSDLPGDHGRSEIRAVLMFGQSGGAGPPTIHKTDCGSLVPSLEVYDQATGKTTVIVTSTSPLARPMLLPQ